MAHLRVVCEDVCGHQGKVFFVDRDGTETEISAAITRAEVRVGDLNTVCLTGYVGAFDVSVCAWKVRQARKSLWRWLFYKRGPKWAPGPRFLTRALRPTVREVTTFGSKWRRYVPRWLRNDEDTQ